MSLEKLAKQAKKKTPQTEQDLKGKRAKAAERKRRQREREQEGLQAFVPGEPCRVSVQLTGKESAYLASAMKIRAVWSDSNYGLQEYLSTLILKDGQQLEKSLAELPACGKCGARLPASCERLHKGEAACLLTTVWKKLKL